MILLSDHMCLEFLICFEFLHIKGRVGYLDKIFFLMIYNFKVSVNGCAMHIIFDRSVYSCFAMKYFHS